jgi:hypothetical protein
MTQFNSRLFRHSTVPELAHQQANKLFEDAQKYSQEEAGRWRNSE